MTNSPLAMIDPEIRPPEIESSHKWSKAGADNIDDVAGQ